MNPNGDLLSRCPKHPSQPPFTGFCSACLLERLSAASLPSPSRASSSPSCSAAEITTETRTSTRFANPRPARSTLLYLFHLDDMANGSTSALHHLGHQQQDLPSQGEEGQGDPPLQRKRSLRQPCDWIVCCDTASESWLPSRQSWDGSGAAAAAADPQAQLAPDRRNKASLRSWNQVWDRRVAKPLRGFVNKPAHVLLKRSLSESWRHGREDDEDTRRSSEGGRHPPGRMDSEISSLAKDSSSIHADARRDSLMKRLYWLGRSRSVHSTILHLAPPP